MSVEKNNLSASENSGKLTIGSAGEEKKKDGPIASLSEVFSNAEPYDYLLMAVGSIGGLATGISLPIFNVLFGRLLNNLNSDGNNFIRDINFLCVLFVVIAVGDLIAGFFQVYCWSATGERQTQKFRMRYVRSILSQEVGWFDVCGAGELSTNVAELTGKIQDGLGRKMGDMCQYGSQVVASLGVAFYLSWKLTLVLLCAVPFIGFAGFFLITAVSAAMHQALEQYSSAGGLATESLSAIRTVTALNMQPGIITRYRKHLFEALRVGTVKGLKVGLGNGGVFCACFLTYALGFWYGGNLVADSKDDGCSSCVTGGDIMAAFFSTIMGSIALGQIAPPLTAFAQARSAVASMLEVINRKPLIDGLSDEGLKPDTHISGAIEIRDVEFAYPARPDIIVCKDYQLQIKPGETVALVGPSGCGKSTIINLLLRFYDPQAGMICLDNYNIKELNIKWLRSQIGYVGQEPVLFAGTIADNIAYGLSPEIRASGSSVKDSVGPHDERTEAAKKAEIMAKVIAAAKLANAHDFITEFPKGYDTDVGSNGVAMSGGQKQRIAIARALIKKPAVLLLDEATSALDATSERIVQQSIDALAQSKAQTTIIIAHRLSTIRNADKICAIRDGRIAEMGTHDELIAKKGIYADLIRLQMQHAEEEPDMSASQIIRMDETEEAGLVSRDRARTESAEPGPSGRRYSKLSTNSDVEAAAGADEPKASSKKVELTKEESTSVARRIRGMILAHPVLLAIGIAGAMLFGAIFPCWGLMLAETQNMFFLDDTGEIRRRASLYACYYILLAGCALIGSTGQYYGVVAVGERVSSSLRSQMFEALMRRNIGFFDHEENAVGTLTTRLAEDSGKINKAFGEGLAKQIQAAFTLLIGLALGFSAAWQIAFVVIACFPLSIAASAVQMNAISGKQYDMDQGENEPTTVAKKGEPSPSSTAVEKKGPAEDKKKKASTTATNSTMSGGPGSVISTAFTHMRTVSAFSMHHSVANHYESITESIATKRTSRGLIAGVGFGGSNMVLFLTYSLLFWYGAQLIDQGKISFVELMTAILTLMLGALGLGQALSDMGDQKAGVEIADRIFKDIDAGNHSPIDGLSVKGITPTERAKGLIELKNVNFSYPARRDVSVCRGYSLTISPGETVALVGPSGSGKSTIINLLLRFYDPDSGVISLDGTNIKDLNVRWLRSQIGYVGQEPVLFTGNILSNILRGRSSNIEEPLVPLEQAMREAEVEYNEQHPHQCLSFFGLDGCVKEKTSNTSQQSIAPVKVPQEDTEGDIEMGASRGELTNHQLTFSNVPDDVIEACKAANAHDFISTFPLGYETEIGEGSIMVSGGQKQRIAIARALIKKPSILLLDEATSALDAASERIVQQSIDALAQSKAQTTIIIAHRLSTIRNADKIVVVDKGSIVEMGKHEELLQKPKGLYKQLWEKQNGGSNNSNN